MPLFLDALGIAQAHVVGYSCGAYVGCYLASKYPDRVKSLVTIGGAAYPHSEGCEDYLPEALLRHNDLDFIETARTRHLDAHRGDWQTYLTMTVEDWKTTPMEAARSCGKGCRRPASTRSRAAATGPISSASKSTRSTRGSLTFSPMWTEEAAKFNARFPLTEARLLGILTFV